MRLHSVAAEYFQLVRNDFIHWNSRGAVLRQHKANLNVLAALAQIADGIETGSGLSEGVQGNVNAALRDLADRFGNICDFHRIHSGNRAQSASQTEFVFGNIYPYEVGTYSVIHHDRRQTYTAAAVDCYPLSGRGFALIDDRAKGGYKPAAQTGSRRKIKRLRQAHKIHAGVMNGHIFGK